MKILVYTSLFPNHLQPNRAIFIKQRMFHFAKLKNCEIAVVAPIPFCPKWLKFEPWHTFSQINRCETMEGIDVFHPRYPLVPKISMPFHGLLMFLWTIERVRKIQKEFDFDLIDGHYIYPDGLAAVLLGKIFNRPVVLSARGSDINQFAGFRFIRPMIRYALKKADHIISVCQALAKEMIRLEASENKVSVIPNGIDPERFTSMDQILARNNLGIPENKKVILSVGGLIPRKGFDVLISAMPKVLSKISDAILYIVGNGPEKENLLAQIKKAGLTNRVILVGQVPNEKLNLWYSAADIFCLASSREGWANVLMESLACGTPVIATNVWGAPEIITCTDVGFLVDRDSESIASAIVKAFQKKWDRKSIRNHVARRTWDVVANEVKDIFDQTLSRPN